MNERKKLTDILHNGDRESLESVWKNTKEAADFGILPAGEYIARIVRGDLSTAKQKGTPCYRLTFKVTEGEHAGCFFWHECWLTPAALPMAKRDLKKLAVTDLAQLEKPLPPGIRVKVKLALRRDDNGNEQNKLRTFEVIGIDPPDPFAPPDANGEGVKQ